MCCADTLAVFRQDAAGIVPVLSSIHRKCSMIVMPMRIGLLLELVYFLWYNQRRLASGAVILRQVSRMSYQLTCWSADHVQQQGLYAAVTCVQHEAGSPVIGHRDFQRCCIR